MGGVGAPLTSAALGAGRALLTAWGLTALSASLRLLQDLPLLSLSALLDWREGELVISSQGRRCSSFSRAPLQYSNELFPGCL